MNVFDFAMKMEADGIAYYQKLARQSCLPGLRTIFTRLAEDEQKHYEIFRELKASGSAPAMQDTAIVLETKKIFTELSREEEPLKGLKGDLEAYKHAMKIESDSFRFYEAAASKEKNPETKNLLMKIAGEEHKHFNVMENIFHFINAPNQYLGWAEFSNLDEFRQFGRDVDA